MSRYESIVPIGAHVFVVLPDDEGRNFLCPVQYTGYTIDVTAQGKTYKHYVSELDPNGIPANEEDEVDPGLIRWTEFEALEAFKTAFPGEPIFGVLHQPSLEDVALAAGV